MTQSRDQSRHAFELHQAGYSLQKIADCLGTSDDRASQLITTYQQQILVPVKPAKPWWHGLSHQSRVVMEDLGLHSREDIEAAYRDGAFTEGHPNCLNGLSKYMRKRIEEWVCKPR